MRVWPEPSLDTATVPWLPSMGHCHSLVRFMQPTMRRAQQQYNEIKSSLVENVNMPALLPRLNLGLGLQLERQQERAGEREREWEREPALCILQR